MSSSSGPAVRIAGASRSAMIRLTSITPKKMSVKTAAGTILARSSWRHVSPNPTESNQRKSV
jgi:hypothetical protein